jgi:2-polyprenyl-6-methoxyphenol hydroxylase-like FAD-dependent oxidoreductase
VAWYAVFAQKECPRNLWELSRLYLDWHEPIIDLILRADEAHVVQTRLRDLPPSRDWGDGRVTLIGDAIHAVSADLSQGACQAIESAQCLADAIAKWGPNAAALRRYETQRRFRTARIGALSYLTAVHGLPEDEAVCRLRDIGMCALLPLLAPRELRWILGAESRSSADGF